MIVYLLPIARDRFELYSEPADDAVPTPERGAGRVRRWLHSAHVRWSQLVDAAREGTPSGRFARWRDRVICRLSETIAEQRTLWALGRLEAATLLFPSTTTPAEAPAILNRLLSGAQRHHGIWMSVDLPLFIVSGFLAVIPGPNIVAYYLAFRGIGHFLAWRGARQALKRIQWTFLADTNLGALTPLVGQSRFARADRVAAIAADLKLPRLAAFFERVAE